MPTATATLGWTLQNWGPVPATFTHATTSSCNPSTAIYIADTDVPSAPFWRETCRTTTTPNPCWPTPTDADLASTAATNPFARGYWSGNECPDDWTSIGQAAYPTNGPVTSSGYFREKQWWDDDFIDWDDFPVWDDLDDIFDHDHDRDDDDPDRDDYFLFGFKDALGALLDRGETAVACCPRTMTPGANGYCYTTLPSHTVTTACFPTNYPLITPSLVSTTYILDGATHTGRLWVPAANTRNFLPGHASTTTFSPRQTDELVAVSILPPVYVVHREGDDSQVGSGSSSNSNAGSGSGNGDPTNAAGRVRVGLAGDGDGMAWGHVRALVGVLGMSVLAGMALVLPW
ncbi:hypothetical protein BJX61DRAFT_551223 [Aspergillus egyptiacus]|nr:hypothetical protein BJX61DRAFT_551223 [Aspergillus egyptiacus]